MVDNNVAIPKSKLKNGALYIFDPRITLTFGIDIIAAIVKTPEFALTSKASIEQIVELVSFRLSFISYLTTLLAQTEEATCRSVVVLEVAPVPKDNEDGEDSADGAADLLRRMLDKVDKLVETLLALCLACLRLSGILFFFTLLYFKLTDGTIYLILRCRKRMRDDKIGLRMTRSDRE